jgi:hypothetical protein
MSAAGAAAAGNAGKAGAMAGNAEAKAVNATSKEPKLLGAPWDAVGNGMVEFDVSAPWGSTRGAVDALVGFPLFLLTFPPFSSYSLSSSPMQYHSVDPASAQFHESVTVMDVKDTGALHIGDTECVKSKGCARPGNSRRGSSTHDDERR